MGRLSFSRICRLHMIFGFLFIVTPFFGQAVKMAVPTKAQYEWQEMEQTMFVCLDPCTWQNREYDNHTTDLNDMKLPNLDTDQWCEAALSFDAKLILMVAKHTGGFCWWQTDTSDYSVKNIPWKDGKGDILADLSKSCKKYGLKLGMYVYPGDDTWGASMGSGGKTTDPLKQEAYNAVYRQQLTEVLTNYGEISEVWFDGSCIIDVDDILSEHAPNAVVLQSPQATLRWVGNEKGIQPLPYWYTVNTEDAKTGVSTSIHGDKDGDVWLPTECDTTLLDHKWFWGEDTDHMLKSTDYLVNLYYQSVGRGSLLLLDSTPDTSGLIPESHLARYKEFWNEIKPRFSSPLAETSGAGNLLELDLGEDKLVDHVIIMEDTLKGQRVLSYKIEGLVSAETGNYWKPLAKGSSIGRKKIDFFNPTSVSKIRLVVTDSKAIAQIRSLTAYLVGKLPTFKDVEEMNDYWVASKIKRKSLNRKSKTIRVNVSTSIVQAAQYQVILQDQRGRVVKIEDVQLYLEGQERDNFLTVDLKTNSVVINRTQVSTGSGDELTELVFNYEKRLPRFSELTVLIRQIM